MRALVLPTLLLLGACNALAPTKTEATSFQNARTGETVSACGPMRGFAGAIEKAQQGCEQAWQAKGWVPLDTAVASLPE